MGTGTYGKRYPREEVNGGENVHTPTISLLLYGIERYAVSRVLCFESFGFSEYLRTLHGDDTSRTGHLLRCDSETTHIMYETTNRRDAWYSIDAIRVTEVMDEWVELVFPKVWVFFPEPPEFIEDTDIPRTSTLGLWRTFLWVECLNLLSPFFKFLLPVPEGTFGYPKCMECALHTIPFPVDEYLEPFLRCFGHHIPKPYHTIPRCFKSVRPREIVAYSHHSLCLMSAICI